MYTKQGIIEVSKKIYRFNVYSRNDELFLLKLETISGLFISK